MKDSATIRTILTIIAVYLAFSFGKWELNPAKWEEGVRIFSCVLALFASIMVQKGYKG